MVLLWLHTAITIPIKQANNITGTYASGVYLAASSDNNATYNQNYTTSQEHMVLVWRHTASYNKQKKRKKSFKKTPYTKTKKIINNNHTIT